MEGQPKRRSITDIILYKLRQRIQGCSAAEFETTARMVPLIDSCGTILFTGG